MRSTRTFLAAATAATLALTVAACGSDDSSSAAPAKPKAAASMDGMKMPASSSGGMADMAGMVKLADSKTGDLDVGLLAMPPETFYVSEGDGLRKQAPTKTDNAHLMVTVADKVSQVRLPDASVTAKVAGADGRVAFEGPLYPMVGRGMGLHYGENVAFGTPGDYAVTLTVGPPRVGRHRAVENAWTKTVKVTQKVRFDGKTVAPR